MSIINAETKKVSNVNRYFLTCENHVITGTSLRHMFATIYGTIFEEMTLDELVNICKGIKNEIPATVEDILPYSYTKAAQCYQEINQCSSKEAIAAIKEMTKKGGNVCE